MKNIRKNRKVRINVKVFSRNILIMFVIIAGFSLINSYSFGKKEIKTNEYVVSENQTLWSISKKICKNNSNLNIENVIYDIKSINNLNTSEIYVGQVINIPDYNN